MSVRKPHIFFDAILHFSSFFHPTLRLMHYLLSQHNRRNSKAMLWIWPISKIDTKSLQVQIYTTIQHVHYLDSPSINQINTTTIQRAVNKNRWSPVGDPSQSSQIYRIVNRMHAISAITNQMANNTKRKINCKHDSVKIHRLFKQVQNDLIHMTCNHITDRINIYILSVC